MKDQTNCLHSNDAAVISMCLCRRLHSKVYRNFIQDRAFVPELLSYHLIIIPSDTELSI
jgi:hypothetical protein